LLAGIEARRAEADPKVCIDYGLHSTITEWNDKTRKEMRKVIDAGVPTFKMFMIYESEGWMSDDAALFAALAESADNGARICVHAESERVMKYLIAQYLPKTAHLGAYGHVLSRPNFIEQEAISRAVTWAAATGGHLYIVHMSTREGTDIIKTARDRGIDVIAETCPQYLVLTDDVFKDSERGHLWATCPQIKKKKDNDRLWKGLANGEVSLVATDTCTFDTKQKAMWNGDFTKIPYGLPGSETMVPLLWTHGYRTGRFSLNRLVDLVSTQPAKIHGLYPRKGTIAVGSDADIVIIEPSKSKVVDHRELDTNCDWNPYQGWKLGGYPDVVLSRGTVVVNEGKFVGKVGHGRFIERTLGALASSGF